MEWIKVCDLLMNMDRGLTWQMWRGREPSISSQLSSGQFVFSSTASLCYILLQISFKKKKEEEGI